jgi:DNA-binding GntR family transcriptional regulator
MAQRRLPTDDGYLRLREAIVRGKLAPNQRLVEAEMSSEFGMPRAAVRTALVRLEHEGLVEREPHRGARVRLVSEAEAVEILEARAALESLAVRYAALNATAENVEELRGMLAEMRRLLDSGDLMAVSDVNARLHRRILELSGHTTAMRLCSLLKSQIVRFQFRTILVPGRPEQSFGEHTAVVDAIEAHDADAAERTMRLHLSHVADALRERQQ